ncbi:MAG: GxxExxY protein [Planctomycetes bacterium]|nr:GxxExxY protein [Planctomycetota bacterium]
MEQAKLLTAEEVYAAKEVYQIVGAAIEVHRVLGWGFLEAVYQEAMSIELKSRGVPVAPQPGLPIEYKAHRLEREYRPDFLCFSNIVVELKAIDHLGPAERAQLLNYLRASNCRLGLLINFGSCARLEWQRYVY